MDATPPTTKSPPTTPTSALDPWPGTVTWRPVSQKLIAVELITLAAWTVALVIAGGITWLATASNWAVLAIVVVLVWNAVRAVVVVRAVQAYGYAERDRDLLVRHGRIIRRLAIVPYARMQFVDVTAGPLERAFGLANVQLHTAAAASDAMVPGLELAEARRLRDRLAALGEDRGEGL